jgi:hypothetical protein
MTDTTILYRPAGQNELELIKVGGHHEFPPKTFPDLIGTLWV